jgi:FixJ family two-component response regulator
MACHAQPETQDPARSETIASSRTSHSGLASALTNAIVQVIAPDESAARLLAPLIRVSGTQIVYYGCTAQYRDRGENDSVGCLLLDLDLPDGGAFDLLCQIAGVAPPIICMGCANDAASAVRAMKAGACEFVIKPLEPMPLLAAIHCALERDRRQRQRRLHLARLRRHFERLTKRERQVLPLLVHGLRNKEAAWRLGISEVTLQVHRGQIMRKMGARSFAELVRMGQDLEVLTPVPIALAGMSIPGPATCANTQGSPR